MNAELVGTVVAIAGLGITVLAGLFRVAMALGAMQVEMKTDRDANAKAFARLTEEVNRQWSGQSGLRAEVQALSNRVATDYVHVGRFEAAIRELQSGFARVEEKIDKRLDRADEKIDEKMDKSECVRIHSDRDRLA